MRFEELLDRHERGYLTQLEMGEMLGVSERTVRRWQERYREEGAAGLRDRRIGLPSPRRAPASELARARTLYAEMYEGFTAKHFHEHLQARHGYRLGYTVTRLALQAAGLVKRAPRRGAHRRKRPRRPLPGMLLHQDAARHAWLAGRPPLDLVVTLDDATSEVYSAILVAEEGTASSFRGLAEVVAHQGLFLRALHRPRRPRLPHARGRRPGRPAAPDPGRPGAGAARHRAHRRLFAAGARALGAGLPHAGSPLAQELALAGISEIDAANVWLREHYQSGAQRPLRGDGGATRHRLCAGDARAMARGALPPGDPPGRQRQQRALEGPQPADPEEPAQAPFRARQRAAAQTRHPDGAVALFWGTAPSRRLPAARGGTR